MSIGGKWSLINQLTFSQDKSSPLHPVCEKGYTSLAKILIENGAEMNAHNEVRAWAHHGSGNLRRNCHFVVTLVFVCMKTINLI